MNLIGEHLDYNGGRCLPIALRQTTRARVTLRDDETVTFRSGDLHWEGVLADLPSLEDWPAYPGGVLQALGVARGLEVEISSDVPVGAGLSSSAALECSVAVAVSAALGLGLTRDQLAEACVRAENDFVGAPTGGMDQTVAMHAQEGNALLIDFGRDERELVPFDPAAHDLSLLVMDTRVSHELTDGSYGSRRQECEEAARQLGVRRLAEADDLDDLQGVLRRRATHVQSELDRVDAFVQALRHDDWTGLGDLLDASHTSLRDDFEVSCAELDAAVSTAREAGALGARMTGGGFGGSAIALVAAARVGAVRNAVTVAFAAAGWQEPGFLLVDPGPGAALETA